MIRLTSGKLKGRQLKTRKGKDTRPTLSKTRDAIFNVLLSRYHLGDFFSYDLFAGSGALGFEAYSRGTRQSFFLDQDKAAYRLIQQNIQMLGLDAACRTIPGSALKWLDRQDWQKTPGLFLLDPPYQTDLIQQVIDRLKSGKALVGSLIVVETVKNATWVYPENFHLFQQKFFGGTRLDFLEILLDPAAALIST